MEIQAQKLNFKCGYTGVSEMAQKVFEGDVVFSILIGRFFLDQSKSSAEYLLRRRFEPSQRPPCTGMQTEEQLFTSYALTFYDDIYMRRRHV